MSRPSSFTPPILHECWDCRVLKSKTEFSAGQMKKSKSQRRCKDCCEGAVESTDKRSNLTGPPGGLIFAYPLPPVPIADEGEICPICLEKLWPGDIPELVCEHLFHDECLAEHTQRQVDDINSGRKKAEFGYSPFGVRAGCPVCRQEISNYLTAHYKSRWENPVSWIPRINAALVHYWCKKENLPSEFSNGIPIDRLIDQILEDARESNLKIEKFKNEEIREIILTGIEKGSGRKTTVTTSDGRMMFMKAPMKYSIISNSFVWAHAWGPQPGTQCTNSRCNKNFTDQWNICEICKHLNLAYYCTPQCKEADKTRHNCKKYYGISNGR